MLDDQQKEVIKEGAKASLRERSRHSTNWFAISLGRVRDEPATRFAI
jgi:hypothetical protein